MELLAIVLFFLGLFFVVLFFAMRGGPSSARERREREGRRGVKGATAVFVVALLALGIAIPLGVFASEKDRNSYPEEGVSELTELQQHGQELFGQQCRRCHTLAAANASATVGPNLDVLRPAKGLTLDAIENGRARGNGQMAADLVEGEDAEAVAQFVAVAVGQDPNAEVQE